MRGYLVEGGVNWADEIDFDGYVIVNEKTFESDKKVLKTLIDEYPDYEQEIGCGTNEEVTISPEEVLDELDGAVLLGDIEYETFKRYDVTCVGRTCYSMFDIGEAEAYIKKKIEKAERKKSSGNRKAKSN